MKAISNFKALLSSRSRLNSPRLNLSPSDAASPTHPHHQATSFFSSHRPRPSMDEQDFAELKRANEVHAARLVEERKRMLQSRGSGSGSLPGPEGGEKNSPSNPPPEGEEDDGPRGHGEPPSLRTAPPVLGIGTGAGAGLEDHPHPAAAAAAASGGAEAQQEEDRAAAGVVVADSPTAVDFDVYDRAFEEEVERIRQGGGRPSVYMTWHLGDEKVQERFRQEEDVELLEGSQRHDGDGDGNGPKEVLRSNRFADLVAQTIKDTRERALEEVEGGGEEGA